MANADGRHHECHGDVSGMVSCHHGGTTAHYPKEVMAHGSITRYPRKAISSISLLKSVEKTVSRWFKHFRYLEKSKEVKAIEGVYEELVLTSSQRS